MSNIDHNQDHEPNPSHAEGTRNAPRLNRGQAFFRHPVVSRTLGMTLGVSASAVILYSVGQTTGAIPSVEQMSEHLAGAFETQEDAQEAEREHFGSASEAVKGHLPQVAIIGEEPGPADTTEVYIQVPGVGDMQSVFVLSDDETVIAGVEVPAMEGMGTPAGDPLGDRRKDEAVSQAQPDPAQQQQDAQDPQQQIMDQVRQQAEQAMGPYSGAADDLAHPQQAQSPEPAPTQSQQTQSPEPESVPGAPSPAPDTGPSDRGEAPLTSDSSQSGEAASESTPTDESDLAESAPSDAPEPEDLAYHQSESLDVADVVNNEDAFRDAVEGQVSDSERIQRVRDASTDADQQQTYLEVVKEMPAIQQGDGARDLYVFFDPNCPVCHALFEDVAVDVATGELTVHWIPAIVFSDQPMSIAASAALLDELRDDGPDAAVSSFVNMMRDDNAILEGAERYNKSQSTESLAQVIEGTALMAIVRAETPLLVFEDKQGDLVIDRGVPAPGYVERIAVNEQ